jgi:endonuclease/exonuclease/phosphatase family metal-dependent hydrolase
MELRASLKTGGLDLPYWEMVSGSDTNIHVSLLSRFPFSARRPHTNDDYLLNGRRFFVSRGFAEVDVRVAPDFSFTLIAAHLKSKSAVPEADEAQMRLEEAKILRHWVDARLAADPEQRLVVLGDLNDTPDSLPIKTILGRGATHLVDTRPAERNGDDSTDPSGWRNDRTITWTEYYGIADSYSRIDYILVSPAMARGWVRKETYIGTFPNWGVASDHRPLVATFETGRN